jgi:hypothetical protein
MKKPIYRTVIRYEILSEEPIENLSLERIAEECNDGSWSGAFLDEEIVNEELTGEEAVKKIKEQGSDPSFFFMDDEGNSMDDDERDFDDHDASLMYGIDNN